METSKKSAVIISLDRSDTDYEHRRDIEHERISPASIHLSAFVRQSVDLYLNQMKGHDPVGLHSMVITEVEKPLLESALAHFGHNQTKAAKALGLSRSTLRKKLEQYGLS